MILPVKILAMVGVAVVCIAIALAKGSYRKTVNYWEQQSKEHNKNK